MIRTTAICSLVFGCAVTLVRAQGPQPQFPQAVPSNEPLVLTNGNVITIRNGLWIKNATVVLRDGKIESVQAAQSGYTPPAGLRTIDLKGRYVLPGLIDAHAHIADFAAARRALDSGVTTVRDAGVTAWVDVGLRDLVRSGAFAGPDILATGYWIRPRLDQDMFLTTPSLAPLMSGVQGPDAVRQVVRANLAHDVNWIKLFASDAAGNGDPKRQFFSEAELRAGVEEAAAKRVPVFVHSHNDDATIAAVRAGARCVEHGIFLTDVSLGLMKEKAVYYDPTYIDLATKAEESSNPTVKLRSKYQAFREEQTIRRAHQMGLKIVTGTDSSYVANTTARIPREIAEFVRMGFTPLEALQSATIINAEMLGLDKGVLHKSTSGVGTIEPGFDADLLVVDDNPLDDISVLQDPMLIVSKGRVVLNRVELNRRSARQAE